MTMGTLQIFVGALTTKVLRETSALSCLFYMRRGEALKARRILRQKLIGYSPDNDWI
jgi:hypothetical protein